MPQTPLALRLRLPLPTHLLGMALTTVMQQQVLEALDSRIPLETSTSVENAIAGIQRLANVCLVLRVPGHHSCLLRDLLHIRSRFPSVPVVALFVPSTSSPASVLQLGAAGIAEIVTTEPRIVPDDLLAALSRAHADGVASRLWKQCRLALPERLAHLLKIAMRYGHAPVSVRVLAARAGMPERSLRKYCVQWGFPSPQWIIGWARLLLAGYYLDDPGRTIARVAELLQYPSGCALRNHLRRYTHCVPTALRRGGAVEALSRLLERCVGADQALTLGEPLPRLRQLPTTRVS